MKTVTRVLLWQLAALGLYLVPTLTLMITGRLTDPDYNPPEALIVLGLFGPVLQSGLSLLIGLIMMIATRHKDVGAGLMLGGVVVGMIGVTVCFGFVFAAT